jgi:large-conductance mechanosensitive channel
MKKSIANKVGSHASAVGCTLWLFIPVGAICIGMGSLAGEVGAFIGLLAAIFICVAAYKSFQKQAEKEFKKDEE